MPSSSALSSPFAAPQKLRPDQDRADGATTGHGAGAQAGGAGAPKGTDPGETGEAYVFRDFERSRILAIRLAVERDPVIYTLCFFGVAALWTVVMSAGAGMHGRNLALVNLTPHVAHFTIILGFFFYPLRLIWIPVLAYLAVFLYPFVQPLTNALPWHDIDGMSAGVVMSLFAINLGFGLVIGMLYRAVFALIRPLMRVHSADLFLSLVSYVIFALVGVAQIYVTAAFARTLDEPLRAAVGFDPSFVELAVVRTLRGCAVVSAFLLATVEYPQREHLLSTAGVIVLFPLLAVMQSQGFVLYPAIDVVVLAALVVFALPVRIALFGAIGGIAIFAAITGEFLIDRVTTDPMQSILERYSILALSLLLLVLAIKSHTGHVIAQKDAAIRKLNRARDFAGVGLFAVNRATGLFRLDDAAQRMLSLPAQGGVTMLRDALEVEDAAALMRAMMPGAPPSRGLALHAATGKGMRAFVWTDASPTGDPVAYGILLDVTEAEQREAQLHDTLEELSTRQERQRQLFSIVSHELRTPASVMSILIDDLPVASDPARLQRQMREAADQLLSVLGDMRQTVNPEKNLPVKRVPYVPSELAESLRNTLELTAREHDMRLTLALGVGAGKARVGDVMRLRQALSNLMRNAVIHSQGSLVRLSFSAQAPAVAGGPPISQWQVEDNGIGIPDEQVDRLFQPFERGSQQDPRSSVDGSGLGLYIARQSVEMLGGTLQFYRPLRGGAGYMLRLPEPLVDEAEAALAPPAAAAPAALPDAWSVVLAEDNALVADVTRARLERLNATVRVAENGMAALALVRKSQPDIVITDLFMPELDGDDLVRRLRQQGYTRPIVGLTAAVVGEEMQRFKAAGANVVMQKPLDFTELLRLLREGFPAAPESAMQ